MSSSVYYYRNGTYEDVSSNNAQGLRSIYGPAPFEDVLTLVRHIPSDLNLNPNWRNEVENQLKKRHFRHTQILSSQENVTGIVKISYLFEIVKWASAHEWIVSLAFSATVFAPGYLVKNWPKAGLFIRLPTLTKMNEILKGYFFHDVNVLSLFVGINHNFLEIFKDHFAQILPIYFHLQNAKNTSLGTATDEVKKERKKMLVELFRAVQDGIFAIDKAMYMSSKATLADFIKKLPIAVSDWRFFGFNNYYNSHLLFAKLTHGESGIDEAYLSMLRRGIKIFVPHLDGNVFQAYQRLRAQENKTTYSVFKEISELIDDKVMLPATLFSKLFSARALAHLAKLEDILKKVAGDHPKTSSALQDIDKMAMQCAHEAAEYFREFSLNKTINRVSKEIGKEFQLSWLPDWLPYRKKIRNLYKDYASIAKFTRIEWQLIGSNFWSWSTAAVCQRKWSHIVGGVGVLAGISITTGILYKRLIGPFFARRIADFQKQKRMESIKHPRNDLMKRMPPAFTSSLSQIDDFIVWHAYKMGSMRGIMAIPNEFENDPVLTLRRCPIFGTPIRIPVKLVFGDGTGHADIHNTPYVFEELHIQAWVRQQVNHPIVQNLPAWWSEAAQSKISDGWSLVVDEEASDEIELRILLLQSQFEHQKTATNLINRYIFNNGLYP